jgi:hypothetical protein
MRATPSLSRLTLHLFSVALIRRISVVVAEQGRRSVALLRAVEVPPVSL